ncbi:hypothetical protein RHSIM_Rhsim10G0198700 [Rhododendron simsii]|uniref:Uncharacterized protein n=1 Tax=Rhododendron simsii TaxID=118357 RepID=A0A834GGE7_RHOSS|nr:hypothetical protein RHSIM_Rhsim10G0198700 [Rhododendron simsii]
MPKKTTVPSLSSDRSNASQYPSPAKTAWKNMVIKLVQSVLDKKDMEEARCSICMEPPHNAVLLHCSNIEKGCHSYMCDTSNHRSNWFNQFRKSPDSTPTFSCPQCGVEVINGCIVLAAVRDFMNSRPRRCSVETCEFTGNYQELVHHVSVEHPLERVRNRLMSIEYISTELMIADPLTKGLPPKVFKEHVARAGVSAGSPTTSASSYATGGRFLASPGSSTSQGRLLFAASKHTCIDGEILPTSNLKAFSFRDLKSATGNFRVSTVLGQGKSSTYAVGGRFSALGSSASQGRLSIGASKDTCINGEILPTSNLKAFSFGDLKSTTENFRTSTVLQGKASSYAKGDSFSALGSNASQGRLSFVASESATGNFKASTVLGQGKASSYAKGDSFSALGSNASQGRLSFVASESATGNFKASTVLGQGKASSYAQGDSFSALGSNASQGRLSFVASESATGNFKASTVLGQGKASSYAKGDNFSASGSNASQGRLSFAASEDTCIDGEILPTSNLKAFSFGDLKSGTENFRVSTVSGQGKASSYAQGDSFSALGSNASQGRLSFVASESATGNFKASTVLGQASSYAKGDNFSASGSNASQGRLSFAASEDTCIDGEILPTSNLKAFSFGDLKSGTGNFRISTVLGQGKASSYAKGDCFSASGNNASQGRLSFAGSADTCIDGEIVPTSNLKAFSFGDLKSVTGNFKASTVLGQVCKDGEILPTSNLKAFSFGDLKSATGNFTASIVLGQAAGLSYVASAIERPLYVDSVTAQCKRLNYARVCVEIEVGATFPLSFDLRFDNGEEVEIKVKYPWKPLQCLECLVFGHSEAGCLKNHHAQVYTSNQVWVAKAGKSMEVGISAAPAAASPSKVLRPQKDVQVSGSNRFAALESIDLETNVALGAEEVNVASVSNELSLVHNDVPPPKESIRVGQDVSELSRAAQQSTCFIQSGQSSLVGKVQDMGILVSQDNQNDVQAAEFPNGVNGGPEPPGPQKKTRKPNKKKMIKLGAWNIRVYGMNQPIDRGMLWDELRGLHRALGVEPWILLGDFNVVRKVNEQSIIDNFYFTAAAAFNSCIDDIEVDDLPAKGFWFSWSNKSGGLGQNKSRINRVVVNHAWQNVFTESEAVFAAPGISDHCSLIVSVLPYKPRRKPLSSLTFG